MASEQPQLSDLAERLVDIIDETYLDPDEYPWASEEDRWAELVFCLLDEFTEPEPVQTRMAIYELEVEGLLDVEQLAAMEIDHEGRSDIDEEAVVITHILRKYGFSDTEIDRSLEELVHVAQVVQREYNGQIQKFLRKYGDEMRGELLATIDGGGLSEQEHKYAVTRWLQNAASMPISLEHEAVQKFCEQENVDVVDLWAAADELQWNLAIVDDILERHFLEEVPAEDGVPGGE